MDDAKIDDMLASYDKNNLTVCTVCSHSSLQIFDGARKEGFKEVTGVDGARLVPVNWGEKEVL